MSPPAMEVAYVMRTFGEAYLGLYGDRMPAVHCKVIVDITACRTQAMGGTTYYCPDCDRWQYSYHSCGNRNCNKCGNERAQRWPEKTGTLLLPVEHFMVTVTLPGELRQMARSHQRLFYGLLMSCSAASLQTLGWDSRFVGGQMAMMGVLHTWGQDLSYHPHVHMIVAGGGLWADEGLWLAARSDFLMPVKALSKIVAAKFRDGLKKQASPLYDRIDPSVWRGDPGRRWKDFAMRFKNSGYRLIYQNIRSRLFSQPSPRCQRKVELRIRRPNFFANKLTSGTFQQKQNR